MLGQAVGGDPAVPDRRHFPGDVRLEFLVLIEDEERRLHLAQNADAVCVGRALRIECTGLALHP